MMIRWVNSFYISIKLLKVALYDNNPFKAKSKYCTWYRTAVKWRKKTHLKAVKLNRKLKRIERKEGKVICTE